MSELKACPFCGGERILVFPPTCRINAPYDPNDRLFPIARCAQCCAEVPGDSLDWSDDSRTARKCWNTRTPETRELREALEAIAEKAADCERIHNLGDARSVRPEHGSRLPSRIIVNQTMCNIADIARQALQEK